MDRFSFQADMFVWFVAVSICFWRTTLQSPSHSSTYWLLFPIRPGRFVATYSFALFCEISYLINGFYFPFFCDLRFLTKRNLYSLDFSSLNRNNRSISCNIMQNLGACCWLVHLFDACFQRFGINLTFLVGFSNFEYFRWKCCCTVRNWPNASSWPWTISRGSHALLSCLFQKKYEFTTFFVNSIAKFGNLSFQQQIPLEPMATDCSKLARRPFWNHFESGYFFWS